MREYATFECSHLAAIVERPPAHAFGSGERQVPK
jgi:hypothetical protein